MRTSDDDKRSTISEDVDSAASTLFGHGSPPPKWRSLDEAQGYTEIELKQLDETSRHKIDLPLDDSEEALEVPENERLLSHDTAVLNAIRGAADILPDDSEPPPPTTQPAEDASKQRVSWSSLPKKGQLVILTLARLSEPLTQTSLQSYMFYQLKSFTRADGSTPSDSTVASQVGMLAAAFTGAQFLTAMIWGRLADSDRMGRKWVILIGLLGTTIGTLGFGFSESFLVAMFWRAIGGVLNGNIGVMRTMISEIVKEKKFQSRAFLLLPLCFNIGVIIGPLLGGLLANPAGTYPALFGPGGKFGGKDGVWLFERWPYALPNIVSAVFLFGSAIAVIFGLDETLDALKDKPDFGRRFSRWISRSIFRKKLQQDYSIVTQHDATSDTETGVNQRPKDTPLRRKLPFRRIWTKNVLLTFLSYGLNATHIGGFSNIWFVFLSTPRYNPDTQSTSRPRSENNSTALHLPPGYKPHAPFVFTGGLGLPPPSIGSSLAILGVLGITLQLLFYPRVSSRLGTLRSFRYFLPLFCVAYAFAPFLATIPSTQPPPAQATGVLVWVSITAILLVQVLARTFVLPSVTILVNNSCPHPSVLGAYHGIAQSVSSAARTVGPIFFSSVYGLGLNSGVVGLAWWAMAGIAALGALTAQWVKEGDGHEIWLEGEHNDSQEEK